MNAKEIIEARNTGHRVGGMSIHDLAPIIRPFLKEIFEFKDIAYDERKDINTPAEQIARHMAVEYPWFTIEEINLAMRLGVTGELGADTRLCSATYFAWLRNFSKSADRKGILEEADKAARIQDGRLSKLVPPEVVAARNEDFEIFGPGRAMRRYMEEGREAFRFKSYLAAVYDALCRRGLMPGLNDQARDHCDRAGRKYVFETRRGSTAPEVRQFTIEQSEQGIYEDGYKAEAVLLFFDYAIANGIDLPYKEFQPI